MVKAFIFFSFKSIFVIDINLLLEQ